VVTRSLFACMRHLLCFSGNRGPAPVLSCNIPLADGVSLFFFKSYCWIPSPNAFCWPFGCHRAFPGLRPFSSSLKKKCSSLNDPGSATSGLGPRLFTIRPSLDLTYDLVDIVHHFPSLHLSTNQNPRCLIFRFPLRFSFLPKLAG